MVRRWLRSGQSMNAFARERGMNVQRLIYWRKRLEPESLGEERRGGARRLGAGSKLVPAVVIGTGCALSVRLCRGVIVEAVSTEAIEPEWLAELQRALEGES